MKQSTLLKLIIITICLNLLTACSTTVQEDPSNLCETSHADRPDIALTMVVVVRNVLSGTLQPVAQISPIDMTMTAIVSKILNGVQLAKAKNLSTPTVMRNLVAAPNSVPVKVTPGNKLSPTPQKASHINFPSNSVLPGSSNLPASISNPPASISNPPASVSNPPASISNSPASISNPSVSNPFEPGIFTPGEK